MGGVLVRAQEKVVSDRNFRAVHCGSCLPRQFRPHLHVSCITRSDVYETRADLSCAARPMLFSRVEIIWETVIRSVVFARVRESRLVSKCFLSKSNAFAGHNVVGRMWHTHRILECTCTKIVHVHGEDKGNIDKIKPNTSPSGSSSFHRCRSVSWVLDRLWRSFDRLCCATEIEASALREQFWKLEAENGRVRRELEQISSDLFKSDQAHM